MGLLGKYMAFRWASRGPGGPDSGGGDGGGGMALFVLIVGGTMAVFLLLGYVLTGIGSFVYDAVRPILLIAPKTSVVVGGILIGGTLVTVPRYSPETATRILTGDRPDGTTGEFYIRNLTIVALMGGILVHVVSTGGGLPSVWIEDYTANPLAHLVGNLAYAVAFLYVLYKFVHLPYRYHRLLRYSPFGTVYTIATLFPVTASLVITVFDLPVTVVDASPSSPIAIAFVAGLVAVPYVLPLVFVKLRAEPYILAERTRSTAAETGS